MSERCQTKAVIRGKEVRCAEIDGHVTAHVFYPGERGVPAAEIQEEGSKSPVSKWGFSENQHKCFTRRLNNSVTSQEKSNGQFRNGNGENKMVVTSETRKEAEAFAKRNAYEFEDDAIDILDLMAAFADDRVAYEEAAWQDKTSELQARIATLETGLKEIKERAKWNGPAAAHHQMYAIWEAARVLLNTSETDSHLRNRDSRL